MSISRDDALEALHEVERAKARSLNARVYRATGVQLIGWGVVWVIGYGLAGFRPHWSGIAWPLLILVNVIFSFMVVRRRVGRPSAALGWRWTVTGLCICLFFMGTYTVFPATSASSAAAFPALVVAFAYAMLGGWRFTRFLAIGGGLFVLTMIGVLYVRPLLDYWLAVVGGGALVLGGAWLMRA